MRPVPIPDDEVWPGHERVVMGAPNGSLTDDAVRPVEMMTTFVDHGGDGPVRVFTARYVLDDGELERLAAGEPFYLSLYGHVVPFDIAMTDEPQ